MSDYFLNKIYDSLLVNKQPKTKSTFRTLSESYDLVYEEEAEVTSVTPEQPTVTNKPNPEQNVQQEQFKFPDKPLIDINEPKPTIVSWNPEQRALFKQKTTGIGNGEYSVASVIAGCTRPEDCALLVSGQSLSYDISLPPESQLPRGQKPTYMFEVKELEAKTTKEGEYKKTSGSVRIGREGETVNTHVTKTVERITTTILDIYSVLDEGQQQAIDQYIISQAKEEKEPSIFIKGQTGGRVPSETEFEEIFGRKPTEEEKNKKIKSGEDDIVKYKNWRKHQEQKAIWTVERWANGIRNNLREIPFNSVIFGPDIENIQRIERVYRAGYHNETEPAFIETRLIFTLKQFVQLINKMELSETQMKDPEDQQVRVTGLSRTFKQFYGQPGNTQTELNQKLDQEANKIDRYLTKIKVDTTKTDYQALEYFVREIKKLNLLKEITDLQNYINNPKIIWSMFPEKLTGLFVVTTLGYHYFPRKDLPTFIYIDQISSGGPKIKIR